MNTSDECLCRERAIDRGDLTKKVKAKEDERRHDDSNRVVSIIVEISDLNIDIS
jgi:hypothetical protein